MYLSWGLARKRATPYRSHNFAAIAFNLLLSRATLICAFPSLLTRIEVAY